MNEGIPGTRPGSFGRANTIAHKSGFALIQTLITMAILLVLAAITYPRYSGLGDGAELAVMTDTVQKIRKQIQYQAARGSVPQSAFGFPEGIDPTWFIAGEQPVNIWTRELLDIQVVLGPRDKTKPNNLSFKIGKDGQAMGPTAWYNTSNGWFCARVPNKGTLEQIASTFDTVNGFGESGTGARFFEDRLQPTK